MAVVYGSGVVIVIGGGSPATDYEIVSAEHDRLYRCMPETKEPAVEERPEPAPMWKGRGYRKGKRGDS